MGQQSPPQTKKHVSQPLEREKGHVLKAETVLFVLMTAFHLCVGAEVQPGGGERREAFPVTSSSPLTLQPCHASGHTQTRQQTQ